jgi:hypothetical protein
MRAPEWIEEYRTATNQKGTKTYSIYSKVTPASLVAGDNNSFEIDRETGRRICAQVDDISYHSRWAAARSREVYVSPLQQIQGKFRLAPFSEMAEYFEALCFREPPERRTLIGHYPHIGDTIILTTPECHYLIDHPDESLAQRLIAAEKARAINPDNHGLIQQLSLNLSERLGTRIENHVRFSDDGTIRYISSKDSVDKVFTKEELTNNPSLLALVGSSEKAARWAEILSSQKGYWADWDSLGNPRNEYGRPFRDQGKVPKVILRLVYGYEFEVNVPGLWFGGGTSGWIIGKYCQGPENKSLMLRDGSGVPVFVSELGSR